MVAEILKFYCLRPDNVEQISSFSDRIKAKVRVIYLHSGVGALQVGGLRVLAEAIASLPREVQRDFLDEVHIVESRLRLKLRVSNVRLASKLADSVNWLRGRFFALNGELFKKVHEHNSVHNYA